MSLLEHKFTLSCDIAKKINPKISKEELLALYGLYKQSTVGMCKLKEPSSFNIKEHYKWTYWMANKDMDKDVAKEKYCTLVMKMIDKHGVI